MGTGLSIRRRLANSVKRVIRSTHTLALFPMSRMHRAQLLVELSQEMVPVVDVSIGDGLHDRIRLFCPSYDTLSRANTLMTKEPETIRWINSFRVGDVLWDIGANIGVYSLYAARKMQVRVLSFEPSAGNYWVLNKNIELNELDELVSAYCIALGRRTAIGSFNMADTDLGGACYEFGQRADAIDYPGLGRRRVVFHQGTVGFAIDEFMEVFHPPFPTHLKIDVDGLEHEILMGAMNTLRDPRVESISVEIEETAHEKVRTAEEIFRTCGFDLKWKEHAPDTDELSQRIYNYLFVRA